MLGGAVLKCVTNSYAINYGIGSIVSPISEYVLHKVAMEEANFDTPNGLGDIFVNYLGILVGILRIDKIKELLRSYITC